MFVVRWLSSETAGVGVVGLGQLCPGDLCMFSWIPLGVGLSGSAARAASSSVLQNVRKSLLNSVNPTFQPQWDLQLKENEHVFHNTNGRWLFINLSGRILFFKFCEAIGFSSPFRPSFSVLILLQCVVLCLWRELFWWVSRDSQLCLSFKYVKTYVASVHAFVTSQSAS